ncbi:MAG: transcription factor IIB, partial [Nitrosopumilaceae archaeon]|nr:transcription factor IIB [Nitrosopumilaceae archaeon]
SSITDGKAPNGIAAAYLYVASVLLGQSILQRDVSTIAGVTEVTIRNRCKEILTSYKLKIALRPTLAKI